MGFRLDRYSYQAEALPTLLMIVPVALFIAVLLPEGTTLKGLLLKFSPFVALAALSFVASQVGADFGRRLEKRLWAKWDGPPTTRFLRHRNREYNEITRHAVHERMARLGFKVPTEDEEAHDPENSDEYYAAFVAELRRVTRNKGKYPLVHKRLIDYGFRRNMLGLKWIGLVTPAVVSLLCALHTLWKWDEAGLINPVLFVGVVSVGIAIGWLTLVNEKVVSLGAERYADSLLEAGIGWE